MATQTKVATPKLIVAYFPRSATAADLQGVFGQHVAVQAARIARDRNGDSRCYGFVDFHSVHDAVTALTACKRGEVRLVDENEKTWYLKAEHANTLQTKRSRGVRGGANKKKPPTNICASNEASIDVGFHDIPENDTFFFESHSNTIPQEHRVRDPRHNYLEPDYISDAIIDSIFERNCSGDARRDNNPNKLFEDYYFDDSRKHRVAEPHLIFERRCSGDDRRECKSNKRYEDYYFDDSPKPHLAELHYASIRNKTIPQERHLKGHCHNYMEQDSMVDARSNAMVERRCFRPDRRECNPNNRYVEDDYFEDSRIRHPAERHYADDNRSKRISTQRRLIGVRNGYILEDEYIGRSCTTDMPEGVFLRDPRRARLVQDDRFPTSRAQHIPQGDNLGIPRNKYIPAADRFIDPRMEYVSQDHHYGVSDKIYITEDDLRIYSHDQYVRVDGERLTSKRSEGSRFLAEIAGQGYSQNNAAVRCQQSEPEVVRMSL